MSSTSKCDIDGVGKCDTGSNSDDDYPSIIYPSARLGAITRRSNQIARLLKDKTDENISSVRKLLSELEGKIKNFLQVCEEQEKRENIAASDLDDFVDWKAKHLSTATAFQEEVASWLDDQTDDLNPSDSVSQVGTGASAATSLESRLREREIKAEIKQKMEFEKLALKEKELEENLKHERARLSLRREQQRLEMKYEKEEIDRMTKELVKRKSKRSASVVSLAGQQVNSVVSQNTASETSLHPLSPPPVERGSSLGHTYHEPSALPCQPSNSYGQPISATHLPRNEPTTFDGEVTNYKPFILSFDRMIAHGCVNDVDKYYYLQRYTTGHPQELVKSCLSADFTASYNNARSLLHRYYGNEVILAQKYLDKLDQWPNIKSEDAKALDEFALCLTTCLNMLPNNSYLNQLNTWKEIKTLVMKLPFDMRKTFRNKAAAMQTKALPVTFSTFVKFVQLQAESLKVPVFGDIKDPKVKTVDRSKQKYNVRNEITMATTSDSKPSKFKNCLCCGKDNHELDNCYFFLKKPIHARETFIRQNRLCFGCLKFSNHQSKTCKNRITCKKCNKSHPTSLHKERLTELRSVEIASQSETTLPEEVQALRSVDNIGRVMCPNVPVGIRKNGSDEILITNMAMDCYATACYIDKDLLRALNINGVSHRLNIKTMENSCNQISVKLVENLELVSLADKTTFKIPKVYAKDKWPFEERDSLKYDDVKSFTALKNVPFKFKNVKIGLLIGLNVPELIKPLEIVNTTKDGPYASKHLFGWAFNGPVPGTSWSTSCFRTELESDYKELDRKINNYFARDFEDHYDDTTTSVEDEVWKQKVSNGIKLLPNRQYQIPLPFRESKVMMPDNSKYALARLNSLRRQLLANEVLQKDYRDFMEDMRARNFIERVPNSQLNVETGKVWFLPHHGVYHEQKISLE